MNSLIIDTSTENLYVALYGKESREILEKGKNHAQVLMKKIDEVLNGLKVEDLDEIIVGVGPGSYTGVRVGVVVAKMFSWTKNIPLKKVSSLYIECSGYEGIRSVSIDARRGNSFCAIYDNDDSLILDEALRPISEFTTCGTLITEKEYKPDMGKIIKKAELVKDPHSLVPNYLRKTEAERNKNHED